VAPLEGPGTAVGGRQRFRRQRVLPAPRAV